MDSSFPEKQSAEPYSVDEMVSMESEGVMSITAERLSTTPSVQIAHLLDRLDMDQKRHVLRIIPEEKAAEVIAELRPEDSAELLGVMRQERAVQILGHFDPDDATDIIGEFEEKDRTRLLENLEPEQAQAVEELLQYDEDSAGGIMTSEVATVNAEMDVDEAISHLRVLNEELETVYYIYVIDEKHHLQGIASIRDMILAPRNKLIRDIMITDIVGQVTPDTDKEEVAFQVAEHNLLAVPVVDAGGVLLGIVTHDDVVDIIQEEATEDLQKLVGAGGDESAHSKMSYSLKRRHPWLLVNLVTAFFAAGIVYLYREQIEKLSLLAVFMPIIAGMGGNSGAQTLAVAIRSLALGEIHPDESLKFCIREGSMAFLHGIITGFIAAGIAYILEKDWMISFVILIAMIMTMTIAGVAGGFIPLALKKLGWDPAQSSSIFLTTVTDVAGFFIFLSLGAWLLIS